MAQKLFSTGPGSFRRAERKETIDDLERTSCDNLFNSEMVLGKNENLQTSKLKHDGRFVGNVSNAKFRCAPLRIKKALGIFGPLEN